VSTNRWRGISELGSPFARLRLLADYGERPETTRARVSYHPVLVAQGQDYSALSFPTRPSPRRRTPQPGICWPDQIEAVLDGAGELL
jgi:hypothetical protein